VNYQLVASDWNKIDFEDWFRDDCSKLATSVASQAGGMALYEVANPSRPVFPSPASITFAPI
jgi:hypothetical protein